MSPAPRLALYFIRSLVLLGVWTSSASAVAAKQHVGRVAHVIDGHSVEVLIGGKRVRVRLAGINAPRQGQPFGLRSRQSLVQLCSGETATVEENAKADGAFVGRLTCNGTDAAAEQLRRGMARLSAEPEPGAQLRAIEEEARAARRGLWSIQPATATIEGR